MNGNSLYVVCLLRRGAQKQAAKPEDGFKNVTICKFLIHIANYTKKIPNCNTLILKNQKFYLLL